MPLAIPGVPLLEDAARAVPPLRGTARLEGRRLLRGHRPFIRPRRPPARLCAPVPIGPTARTVDWRSAAVPAPRGVMGRPPGGAARRLRRPPSVDRIWMSCGLDSGGRPAPEHPRHDARRGPVTSAESLKRLSPTSARVRARPVIGRRPPAIPGLPDPHRFQYTRARPAPFDRAGVAGRRGTTPARCPCGSFSDAALPNPA